MKTKQGNLFIAIITLLTMISLNTCQSQSQPAVSDVGAGTTTATLDQKAATATFDAQKRDDEPFSPADDTRVAAQIATAMIVQELTPSEPPAPTSTYGLPTPAYIEDLGIVNCPLQASHRTYQPINCWRGWVNNNLVTVALTVEGLGDNGEPVDWSYSAILIFNGRRAPYPFDADDAAEQGIAFIKTPPQSGITHIVSAQDSVLTLQPRDPNTPPETLYFDVATLQFIPPPCGAGVTCTPTTTQIATAIATTPVPSPTWQLGLFPSCEAPNSHTFGPVSCWRGIINDQMFSVVSGNGGGGDPAQGVVIVSEGPDFDIPLGYEEVKGRVYDTPERVGPVRIASVIGSQLTLVSLDGNPNATFVFDIISRQFLASSCSGGVTCTPTLTQIATVVATMTVALP